jgi:hypothetical protein
MVYNHLWQISLCLSPELHLDMFISICICFHPFWLIEANLDRAQRDTISFCLSLNSVWIHLSLPVAVYICSGPFRLTQMVQTLFVYSISLFVHWAVTSSLFALSEKQARPRGEGFRIVHTPSPPLHTLWL